MHIIEEKKTYIIKEEKNKHTLLKEKKEIN